MRVCNTGLVFRAEVKGRTLHFQYHRMVGGNEVQKDLETGTSWQQASGEAIDGPLKGTRLKLYPAVRTTWAEWRKRYPHTLVLKPLPGYVERMPILSRRIKDVTRVGSAGAPNGALAIDPRLPPRETVAGLEVGRDTVAYPFSQLRIARVVNDRVGGLPIVIVHQPSSDTTTAFEARAKGKALTFQVANNDASSMIDLDTRSTWNAYGLGLEGPLKGTQLKQVILVPQFWFAWSQFRPGTRVFTARNRRNGYAGSTDIPWIRGGRAATASFRQAASMQAPAPRPAAELARHALTGPFEGYEVVLVELNPAPGSRAAGPGHRHPGAVLGYVVEGQLRFAINNEPEKVLPAGGTFFEPSGAVTPRTVLRGLMGLPARWCSCWCPGQPAHGARLTQSLHQRGDQRGQRDHQRCGAERQCPRRARNRLGSGVAREERLLHHAFARQHIADAHLEMAGTNGP